jgi:hypothetical protein
MHGRYFLHHVKNQTGTNLSRPGALFAIWDEERHYGLLMIPDELTDTIEYKQPIDATGIEATHAEAESRFSLRGSKPSSSTQKKSPKTSHSARQGLRRYHTAHRNSRL